MLAEMYVCKKNGNSILSMQCRVYVADGRTDLRMDAGRRVDERDSLTIFITTDFHLSVTLQLAVQYVVKYRKLRN